MTPAPFRCRECGQHTHEDRCCGQVTTYAHMAPDLHEEGRIRVAPDRDPFEREAEFYDLRRVPER